MILNNNKTIKTALLSAFIMLNSNYSLESSVNKAYFSENKQKEAENVLNKHLNNNTITFEEALKINPKIAYQKLINNALKNNTFASLDSIIKFVPEDILNEYVINNLENNSEYTNNKAFNRLKVLTKTGNEIAQDRFNFQGKKKNSLKNFTNNIDIQLGHYGTKEETNKFLKLYSEDIIRTAEKYNLNPSLLAAIAISESGGRTFTASKTGALGPFGLTKYAYTPTGTWNDGEHRPDINPFNTIDAMDRAADLLSNLITKYKKFDDSKNTLALTAYNQGEREVNKAILIAKENNINNPREIINYTQKAFVNNLDSISKSLEDNLNNNNNLTYLITPEGRNYSGKVQKSMNSINSFFKDLENSYNASS